MPEFPTSEDLDSFREVVIATANVLAEDPSDLQAAKAAFEEWWNDGGALEVSTAGVGFLRSLMTRIMGGDQDVASFARSLVDMTADELLEQERTDVAEFTAKRLARIEARADLLAAVLDTFSDVLRIAFNAGLAMLIAKARTA